MCICIFMCMCVYVCVCMKYATFWVPYIDTINVNEGI